MQKSRKWVVVAVAFFTFFVVCVLWTFLGYKFLERDKIFSIIFNKTLLVVLGVLSLVITAVVTYWESKYTTFKKLILGALAGPVLFFVLSIVIAYAMVAMSNEMFGHRTILIEGPVLEAEDWKGKNHGKVYHSIRIYSVALKRMMYLDVPRSYKKGEIFKEEMRIGRWGIVYKHPF